MTESIEIRTCGVIDAVIRPPGSKSITNRALICSALAEGRSTLLGGLKSEDTSVMIQGLQALGIDISADWNNSSITVEGCGGKVPAESATIHLANSGTSIRFLTALCATANGRFILDGIERMRERPIGDLVRALNQLGSDIQCNGGDFPPVVVAASGLAGGTARIKGDRSSQFLSALLMALPQTKEFTVVQLDGKIVSSPYVQMTCQVMRQFGVDVTQFDEIGEYSVDPRHSYQGREFEIEPDASAASYFWAAAAITGGRCKVLGLGPDALQGDVRFLQVLEEMGCGIIIDDDGMLVYGGAERGVDVDMGDISDTVQTLAAVALFVEGPTTIRGIAHNRHKETDRIGNLAIELRKLGATVDEFDDGMKITPGVLKGAEIETWNDHRMAMGLSLVGLRQPGIVIGNPGCTEKTYPGFFDDLAKVTRQ